MWCNPNGIPVMAFQIARGGKGLKMRRGRGWLDYYIWLQARDLSAHYYICHSEFSTSTIASLSNDTQACCHHLLNGCSQKYYISLDGDGNAKKELNSKKRITLLRTPVLKRVEICPDPTEPGCFRSLYIGDMFLVYAHIFFGFCGPLPPIVWCFTT